MLAENSTLASIAYVLGQTLPDYGVDPGPVFAGTRVDCWKTFQPGQRILVSEMRTVWNNAVGATGDPLIGLAAGSRISPGHYYAFGHSWLASESLLDAMQRLRRYQMILSTVASTIEIQKQRDNYRIVETYPKPGSVPLQQENDFGVAAFLRLCEIAAGRRVSPLMIEVVCNDARLKSGYERHLDAPVSLTTDRTSATFTAADVERSLSTSIPEVVKATDRIAERYIETLDTSKVAARVRHLLIDLLPSGEAHQERVAALLHRSPSTLQRQLQAEETSYREVLETTRDALAREYLADARFSHAQIAYLLGFSDQSNFSRAFKRWTGQSPRDFQSALQNDRSDPAAG